MGDCHVDVGGEDSDEERYQAPRCYAASGGNKETEATKNFCCSTDVNQAQACGERGRNDLAIGLREDEMKTTGDEEEDGEEYASSHLVRVSGEGATVRAMTQRNGVQDY